MRLSILVISGLISTVSAANAFELFGINIDDSGMVESAKLSRGERVFELPSEITDLKIASVKKDDIEIKESPIGSPRVTVQMLSSNGDSGLKNVGDLLSLSTKGNVSTIASGEGNILCMRITINGAMKAKGDCIDHVIVELPQGSNVMVRDQNAERLNQANRAMDAATFVEEVEGVRLSGDKADKMREILKANPDLKVSGADIARVTKSLFIDSNRIEGLQIVIAHALPLSAADVTLILQQLMQMSRLEAFKILIPKVDVKERRALRGVIDQELGHFDKEEALSAILDLE